jgi:hypothetical protein
VVVSAFVGMECRIKDAFKADEDVFDQQAQHALAFRGWSRCLRSL